MASRSRKRTTRRSAAARPQLPDEHAPDEGVGGAYGAADYRRRRPGGRLARRRMLPWSERSVLAVSLLLVLFSTPLWLDPSALYELGWGGRPTPTGAAAATTAPPPPRQTGGPQTPGAPGRVIARDTFSRTVSGGWASADEGGRYTLDGRAAALAVEPGVGVIGIRGGDAGSLALTRLRAHDAALDLSIAVDRLPADGAELSLYAELRRSAPGGAYRPVIHVRADGSLLVGITMRLAGEEHELGTTYRVPDVTLAAGDVVRLRAEAYGRDPTTIRLRVWRAGSEEPDYWHVSVVDWSGALQAAGAVGVGWRLEAAADQQLTLRVDDLIITTTDGGETP